MIFIPGFLGRPEDFAFAEGFDVLKKAPFLTSKKISHIGQDLLRLCPQTKDRVAIGYSLGGRLLLEMVKADPQFFSAVIFVSTNPGLRTSLEREQRREQDARWAEKFLRQEWSSLMKEWNGQAVFAGSKQEPERREANDQRSQLAEILTHWSLAEQEDSRRFIEGLQIPSLWLAGENDPKFCAFLAELKSPWIETAKVPGSGHRIPVDQPQILLEMVKSFLRKKTAEFSPPLHIPPQ